MWRSAPQRILLDKIPRRYVYPWLRLIPVRSEGEYRARSLFPPIGCRGFLYLFTSPPIGCSNSIRVSHRPHSTSIIIHSSRSQHPVNYFHLRLLYSTAYRRDTGRGHHLEEPCRRSCRPLHRADCYIFAQLISSQVKYTFLNST